MAVFVFMRMHMMMLPALMHMSMSMRLVPVHMRRWFLHMDMCLVPMRMYHFSMGMDSRSMQIFHIMVMVLMCFVQAYQEIGGKRIVIAKSLDVYSTTKGGKYGNASKVSAKKTRISVKAGKKAKLSAKAAGKKLNKTAKKMRYVSSNPSVAKVSSKGIITGKKRGNCTVYCIARNGVYKKIKVTTK